MRRKGTSSRPLLPGRGPPASSTIFCLKSLPSAQTSRDRRPWHTASRRYPRPHDLFLFQPLPAPRRSSHPGLPCPSVTLIAVRSGSYPSHW